MSNDYIIRLNKIVLVCSAKKDFWYLASRDFFSRMVLSFYEVVPPVADIRFIGLVQLGKLTSQLLECQRRKRLTSAYRHTVKKPLPAG